MLQLWLEQGFWLLKPGKLLKKGSDGSYLADKETVSTLPTVIQPSTSSANSDAIMTMLYEIKETNADLARQLDKVKRHNSTPLDPLSHSLSQAASPQLGPSNVPYHTDTASQVKDPISISNIGQSHPQPHPSVTHHLSQGQAARSAQCQSSNIDPLSHTQEQPGYSIDRRDAVVPNLQTPRNNPSISEAVNNLLTSYEGRVHSELSQGKQQIKKS